jgi:small-conductance mechanosensitive channel
MEKLFGSWQNLLWSAGFILGAAVIGLIVHRIAFAIAGKVTARTSNRIDQSVVKHVAGPGRLILPMLAVLFVLPGLPMQPTFAQAFRHFVVIVLIAGAGWFTASLVDVIDDFMTDRYRLDISDNLRARRIQTQVQVLKRLTITGIGVATLAAVLMTYPGIWNIGAGLFASAGVVGIVVGMAARPALSNLIAGVQIAMTEPIRLDDVVIVEGEWGRIEEIQTTYVVVRIWDLRRLVVPLSYFIDHPFQNWTRTSADLLGTVFLYADYSVPVEEVRQELHRVLQQSPLWDGKVWGLQVTDAKDRVVELRALMSSADSGAAWDLRCLVRERLIDFLQQRYPDSLPKFRGAIQGMEPMRAAQ